ncbi:MAG: antitoxin Xre/MbcA/ParS toxin-binding domain-containing protein [Saprospiraceae bacterium]|nr:DUF2384 domain-containing protein [Saprospiraceae bacterium]
MVSNKQLIAAVEDQDVMRLVDIARKGLLYSTFEVLASYLAFTQNEWSHFLNTTVRTLQRYKKDKKPLPQPISERIIQIQMIYQLGLDVFDDQASFDQWLNMKSIALGGRKPKDLLDSSFGIEVVKDELNRIEYGLFA